MPMDILGGLALVIIVAMNLMMARMGAVPANLDYATTRLSKNGLFGVSYSPSTGTVPVNQMRQWTLRVETAEPE